MVSLFDCLHDNIHQKLTKWLHITSGNDYKWNEKSNYSKKHYGPKVTEELLLFNLKSEVADEYKLESQYCQTKI